LTENIAVFSSTLSSIFNVSWHCDWLEKSNILYLVFHQTVQTPDEAHKLISKLPMYSVCNICGVLCSAYRTPQVPQIRGEQGKGGSNIIQHSNYIEFRTSLIQQIETSQRRPFYQWNRLELLSDRIGSVRIWYIVRFDPNSTTVGLIINGRLYLIRKAVS
jgi:hypothetical protein